MAFAKRSFALVKKEPKREKSSCNKLYIIYCIIYKMFAFFCVMRYNYKNTKGGELFEKREKRTYRRRKAGTKGKYSGLAVYDIFYCRFYSGICTLRYAILAFWRWLTHFKTLSKKVK